ncbi:MAG: murein biosynthesis integral membrane protein MurJ [Bryobacteraceae bacterium]|nr:murein biosynthesis integral membrane protein MurJ [Bryobacteraceae bacterium]
MSTSADPNHAEPTYHVVRSAGIVSAALFLSRVTGLVREIVMAYLFGAGMAYDAFLLGFRIPNLARDLFAEGALSSAFIPTFTEYLTNRSKKEAAALANLVATAIIVIVGALCVLGIIFTPQLVRLLAPGYSEVPGKFELSVTMTRIMFPFLLLVALAAQAMGILNACNQFAVPALASTFFNVGSILGGLAIGFWAGPLIGIEPITGMAIGVVLGGALQMVWQVPSLRRSGFRFRPRFDWSDPGLKRIFRLMAPAILGAAAVQVNIAVNTNFASQIQDPLRGPDGPVSWLGYSFRFMQLPLALFGVAIASATLPTISRSAAAGNLDQFRSTLSRSLGIVFLLTLPSSVGLAVLGEPMIAAIYQGGRFDAYDTQQTGLALSCYAVGLAGYAAIKILTPAFYALGDARTPMIVSLLSIAINLAAVLLLLRYTQLGHAGLALSTSAVAVFGFLILVVALGRKTGGLLGRELLVSTLKVALAAAAMGVAVALLNRQVEAFLGLSRLARLAQLAICLPAGVAVFYGLCRLARVAELEWASSAMAGPLRRWLPFGVLKSSKR